MTDRCGNIDKSIVDHIHNNTIIYVVGPATRNALITIGFAADNILGHESGNGEALAQYIVQEHESHPLGSPSPSQRRQQQRAPPQNFLFLVGEIRRDIIPKTLSSQTIPIPITELIAYQTKTRDFQNELRGVIDTLDELQNKTRWVVVFSPTGADKALEVVKERLVREKEDVVYRYCTIGPTTRDYLVKELEIEPDVVAAVPSPEGLVDAIMAFDGGLQSEDDERNED